MNLWAIFPEQLVRIDGILKLPYVALTLYALIIIVCLTQPAMRRGIGAFLGISVLASGVMLFNLRPGFGVILPPLLLVIVMLYPIIAGVLSWKRGVNAQVRWWAFVWVGAVAHSLSWAVWLMALAGS